MRKKTRFIASLLLGFAAIGGVLTLSSCGKDGKDGETPYIGENGNWWVGDKDLGVSAQGTQGEKGNVGANGNGIASINKTSTDGLIDTYTITYTDNTTTTFTVTNGANGQSIKGEDGSVVTIGENGNWFIDGVDTGIIAVGTNGKTPTIGENGNWFIDGVDTGVKAEGTNGTGVTVTSVEKTNTAGNIDTYTITFSDSTTTNFTVTNGNDGDSCYVESVTKTESNEKIDTYEIVFNNGSKYSFTVTNGNDGSCITIASIEKTSTEKNVDTYTITLTDNNTFTFTVVNGLTPYIGNNGNWWIGEEDTGVLAEPVDDRNITNDQKLMSSGLKYETRTINGVSGYVVTGYDYNVLEHSIIGDNYYAFEYRDLYTKEEFEVFLNKVNHVGLDIVIPNYIGLVPVIGVESLDGIDQLHSISLSKNTIYLAQNSLNNSHLVNVDFNDCEIRTIPKNCFKDCINLKLIDLPETVTRIDDYAFANSGLVDVNLNNIEYVGNHAFEFCAIQAPDSIHIKYIGDNAFNRLIGNVYLTKNVEYVGSHAFGNGFLYLEHENIPTNWGNDINYYHRVSEYSGNGYYKEYYSTVITNVRNNGEFLYDVESGNITLYQYVGNEIELTIPSTLDSKPITKLGYGFNSFNVDDDSEFFKEFDEEEMFYAVYHLSEYVKHYLDIVHIPATVKVVDRTSMLCTSTIYVASGVEKVGACIGMLAADDDFAGIVFFEDASTISFMNASDDDLKTYSEMITSDEYEMIWKNNITKDKIYYDETENIYYLNNGTYYSVVCYKSRYGSGKIVIRDSIDGIPVETIEKYSFVLFEGKPMIIIGNNIKKIRSDAIIGNMAVYVPNNVEIINSNAIGSSAICYIEASAKPLDWDSNWNSGGTKVYYSYSKDQINKLYFEGNFVAVLKDDDTYELVSYTGSLSYYSSVINIPRTINGKAVTSIASGFIEQKSALSSVVINIPASITAIGDKAFDFNYSSTSTSYYPTFKIESDSKPENWAVNWFYNSYRLGNTYCYKQFGSTLTY